jgi:hypothetical protein
VRYGLPAAHFICGAPHLNGLHQVFAAGHMLALTANSSGTWIEHHARHIKRLVGLRREFADALIDGRQEYQPATGAADVAAYAYRGAQHEILIVVNASRVEDYAKPLGMRGEHANSRWLDVLSDGGVFDVRAGVWIPELRVAREGIRVLRRLP